LISTLRTILLHPPRRLVTYDARVQLRALRDLLGRRRYRIAMLRDGRGKTARQIARRMGMTRQAVERHFGIIDMQYAALRTRRDQLENDEAVAGLCAAYLLN
jgi:hypothetical protein